MTEQTDIQVARVYDDAPDRKRARLLVDRVWPRGISKEELGHDDWIKTVAPSSNLRKWFDHDPNKWGEFRNRYLHELADNSEAVERCLSWCRAGPVTLLFSAKDRRHNQAIVLRDYLIERLKGSAP